MEYLIPIGLVIIALVVATVVAVFIRKRSGFVFKNNDRTDQDMFTELMATKKIELGEITIPIELLPLTTQLNEDSLIEIKDQSIVTRISQSLPAVAEITNRTLATKAANVALDRTAKAANAAVKSANQVFESGDIYKVIIPVNTNLANSKTMESAKRAFFHGRRGFKGHANLVPVTAKKASEIVPANIGKTAKVANAAANVMNVASLVVGQYNMTLIDAKLELLTKGISSIKDFQDREFKSRIMSVLNLVSEISQFSTEILENDSQRKLKLSALEGIKATSIELLGQVNITMTEITKANSNPKYNEYESVITELKTLVEFQNVLVDVLEEISKLTYLLGKSFVSLEQSYSIYNKYLAMSIKVRTHLSEWHNKQVDTLKIDLSKERIAKTGVSAIFSSPLGWIDEKHNYKSIKRPIAQEIAAQSNYTIGKVEQLRDVYNEDLVLIIKEGKYYYLTDS